MNILRAKLPSIRKLQGLHIKPKKGAPYVPPPPPDPVIKVLAHRIYGPGYNSGAAPLTGTGVAVNNNQTALVNLSGAPISTCSVVLQGWTLRTTGTTDSAAFTVSGTIEYPVGTQVGTIPATVVQPGTNTESADVILSTPIPAGATFAVKLTSTIANGSTYVTGLGFAGLRNHAPTSTLKKVRIAGFGDSIMTNNNGPLYNAANGRCPAYLNSIIGTTAEAYGSTPSIATANFGKQADLVGKLGCNYTMSDFGTNDFGAGRNDSDLKGYLKNMMALVRAQGSKWVQTTITPRTQTPTRIAATSVVSSGNYQTVTVADITKFVAGNIYNVSGCDQTEYNGSFYCTAVDTVNNTITLLFPGSATSPATGAAITVGPWKFTSTIEFQVPSNAPAYGAGLTSYRGKINEWIRGSDGDSNKPDDFIDWADACEPSRNSGRWKVMNEDAVLPSIQLVNVTSVISTSRFNSNYSRGSSTTANGFVQALTGANIGTVRQGNGNTNGDITVTAAWTNTQVVGDQYYVVPGVSYVSDDGLHPRAGGGGKGGQALLDNSTSNWIDAKLAA